MSFDTRGPADAAVLVDQARAHIAALDPELPTSANQQPLAEWTRASLISFEATAAMLFVFGAAGTTLAAMATYGPVSYTVTQKTREIGIRMALGATALSVVRAFVGRGLRLGLIDKYIEKSLNA